MAFFQQIGDSQSFIKHALGKILSSLIKIVVHFGITYPELSERIKYAYVREVRNNLTKKNEKVTQSRISLMSGVHRKDVKRLLETDEDVILNGKVSLVARLISLWVGDSRYIDERGFPKVLALHGNNSFETLVLSISKDVRSRTVLDDLVERGIVSIEDNLITLNQSALFPSDDLDTKIEFLSRNISDHLSACHHNIQGINPRYPERSVFYDKLSKTSVEKLQALSSEKMTNLILDINHVAQQLAEEDDRISDKESYRFILGTYYFQAREDDHSEN